MLYHSAMQQADADQIVVEPVTGKAMLKDFIRFPQSVYRDDAHWVTPRMFERLQAYTPHNPFFQHAQWQGWLARRGDQGARPLLRIAASEVATIATDAVALADVDTPDDWETLVRVK